MSAGALAPEISRRDAGLSGFFSRTGWYPTKGKDKPTFSRT